MRRRRGRAPKPTRSSTRDSRACPRGTTRKRSAERLRQHEASVRAVEARLEEERRAAEVAAARAYADEPRDLRKQGLPTPAEVENERLRQLSQQL